jgi:hypothetical protein
MSTQAHAALTITDQTPVAVNIKVSQPHFPFPHD